MEIISGGLRKLTHEEASKFTTSYKYVTTSPSICRYENIEVFVPVGFLTDGSSGGPDFGRSWLFHDWLYATHKFTSGQVCSRGDADEVMEKVLQHENLHTYRTIFSMLSYWDPLSLFSTAWDTSGYRGPQFLFSVKDAHIEMPPVESKKPVLKYSSLMKRSISAPAYTSNASEQTRK